jgi:hypothetical protein
MVDVPTPKVDAKPEPVKVGGRNSDADRSSKDEHSLPRSFWEKQKTWIGKMAES